MAPLLNVKLLIAGLADSVKMSSDGDRPPIGAEVI